MEAKSKSRISNTNRRATDDQRLKSVLTTAAYIQMHDAEAALDTAWDNLARIEKNIKECILKLATWSSTQGYSKYNAIRTQVALLLQNNDTFVKNANHNQERVFSTTNSPISLTWNIAGPSPMYRSFETNRKANNFVWNGPAVDSEALGVKRFTNVAGIVPQGQVTVRGDWLTQRAYLHRGEVVELEQTINGKTSRIYMKLYTSMILGSSSSNKFMVFDPISDEKVATSTVIGSQTHGYDTQRLLGTNTGLTGNDITLFSYDHPVTVICDSPGKRVKNLRLVKDDTYPFCAKNNEKDKINHSGYDMDQIINEFLLAKEKVLMAMNKVVSAKESLLDRKNLATIDKVVMDARTLNELLFSQEQALLKENLLMPGTDPAAIASFVGFVDKNYNDYQSAITDSLQGNNQNWKNSLKEIEDGADESLVNKKFTAAKIAQSGGYEYDGMEDGDQYDGMEDGGEYDGMEGGDGDEYDGMEEEEDS